ncbi:MAG: phosphate ABC transporter, permease protein PstA [Methylobacterium sp.]|nr:MAG: phosphate ABC transporter, permease protein PstA [Methylobacterium sp.]
MTDTALAPPMTRSAGVDFDSTEARELLKRRYRAEARFKALGLLAVLVTAAFLAFLLVDILRKGIPSFFEHRATLTVNFDAALIDPKGTRDPADLREGDYQALVRAALQSQFPEAQDRRTRRALDGMISSGAVDDLRQAVLANPGLIGQSRVMPLLFSSDADLFLRQRDTLITRRTGSGPLRVEGESNAVTLRGGGAAFRAALAESKTFLAERRRALLAELATLPAAGSNAGVDTKRTELEQAAASIQARIADANAPETLTDREPSLLVAIGDGILKITEIGANEAKATTLIAPKPGSIITEWSLLTLRVPETNRRVNDNVSAWLEILAQRGLTERAFNARFFQNGDSREPELAGIRGALIGSALTLMVTLLLCVPIGVAAAIYLEEFAPKNRFTDLLEVNINNLAAVPSIVFGLLGLAVFLNAFDLPRSAPLVGGLVLALLVLPTIIIASRAALKAVPPSIKEAALGVGASHQQAVFHHVLPLAMPGIMTGTIIGMAHALGETAPLLMIGMVAFIVDIPGAITEAATVLPVQIFLWSDLPELAFQSRTAGAIIVLLGFLLVMNAAAVILRRMFERRW